MGYLDKVLDLKKEGRSDEDIKRILVESGVTPKDIEEALKQAEIKSAISEFGKDEELQPSMMDGEETEEPNVPIPQQEEKKVIKEKIQEPKEINPIEISQKEFNISPDYYFNQQQSLNNLENYEPQYPPYPRNQSFYTPTTMAYNQYQENFQNYDNQKRDYNQTEGNAESEDIPFPQEQNQDYYEYPNPYYEQGENYPNQNYSQYPQEENITEENNTLINTDNIIEIANQIFSEKIKEIQTRNDSLFNELSLLKLRIEMIDERLRKTEGIIEKLQLSILEKVGSYGQNLENIKKEMNLMQDSFSKIASKF